jgi:Leucine-rich repeat (LRR) protein
VAHSARPPTLVFFSSNFVIFCECFHRLRAYWKLDLSYVANYSCITTIVVRNGDPIQEVSEAGSRSLAQLSRLTYLDLSGCNKVFLSPLATMTALTSLDLSVQMKANDMSHLATLTGLTCLKLRNIMLLRDIMLTPLLSLTGLTSLSLHLCHYLHSTTVFASFTALKNLSLLNFCELDDIGVMQLSQLTTVTSLHLSGSYRNFTSVEALSRMTGLTSLSICRCVNVTHVGVLARLTSLRSLVLSGSYRACGVMAALSYLTLLTSLDLSHLNRDSLALPPLTSLTSLNLSFCREVTNDVVATAVSSLTSLTILNLSGTRVTNDVIAVLGPLKLLRGINLRYTQVNILGLEAYLRCKHY